MGEREHPLLTLQSVSGGNARGGREHGLTEEGQGRRSVHAVPQTPVKETKPQPLQHPRSPATKDRRSLSTLSPSLGEFATMAVKFAAVSTLLVLCLVLMHTSLADSANEEGSTDIATGISARLSNVESGVTSYIREWGQWAASFLLAFGGGMEPLPMEQLQERITTGRTLLREYDDAAGSSRACEGAVRAMIDGRGSKPDTKELLSLASSASVSSAAERNLLAEALVCMGEAQLASSSSPASSAAMKGVHLAEAQESFEAAATVDPTNPSGRSGLGLSYLLIGLEESDDANSRQIIFQSIQHLKAAVRLTGDAKTEDLTVIHAASMHNLGSCYLTLDGTSANGAETTHFLDWAASLTSDAPHSLTNSGAFLANNGAALLQIGRVESAVITLERAASELCSDPSPSARREEACLTVQHNLDTAHNIMSGAQPKTVLRGEESSIRNKVARWNANALAELSQTGVSEEEPTVVNGNATSVEAGEEEDAKDTTTSANDVDDVENVAEPIQTDDAASLPSTPWGMKRANSEMQNALAALEKATSAGPQQPRLLLALARARSSAGDASGAVDAALKAIGVAASDEESESATSYLETLMEKMAEEGSPRQATADDDSFDEHSEKASGFVDRKDFAVSELQLKLELEKLRYKVLEQEMMLGRRPQIAHGYADEHRVLGYQQPEQEAFVQDAPRRRDSESIKEYAAPIKTTKPIEHATVLDGETQEEPPPIDHADQSEPVLPSKNEIVAGVDEVVGETAQSDDVQPTLEEDATQQPVNQMTTPESESSDNVTEAAEEKAPTVELTELPSLFEPTLAPPQPIPPTAKSYMKMADAYLDKGQYALASKQFLKVIKKAPDHLHAHLGYATALERAGKSKQLNTAALAYGNATKVALSQSEEKIDPMAKAGAGGIGENILRRAVQICKSAPSGRLKTLQQLSTYAHTAALAADIHFEVGAEIAKQGIDQEDKRAEARRAFEVANEFVASRNDTEAPYHIASIVELGKIALEYENDPKRVVDLFGKVKNAHMEDSLHVELLVLLGRAYASLGELETAITEYTRAISFPESSSTPSAHHELAIALKQSGVDEHEINLHFEKALDMGMDPTPEAIEALGERNMSLMRALNRQYYKSFESSQSQGAGGGGIMNGGGVGADSASVFAPRADQKEEGVAQSDTLTLLEQGAASYDGNNPLGGAVEGTESNLGNLNAKKQRGSESHLSDIQR
ncbi:hypothetical protein ACHAXT_000916 [Thalassiosira profunda]